MHVFRPLLVVLALGAAILAARTLVVPKDFGIHERGYMYGWYRKASEEDWKKFQVKYQGREYCKDCHAEPFRQLRSSPHGIIECENCHGPGATHVSDVQDVSKRPPHSIAMLDPNICGKCHNAVIHSTLDEWADSAHSGNPDG